MPKEATLGDPYASNMYYIFAMMYPVRLSRKHTANTDLTGTTSVPTEAEKNTVSLSRIRALSRYMPCSRFSAQTLGMWPSSRTLPPPHFRLLSGAGGGGGGGGFLFYSQSGQGAGAFGLSASQPPPESLSLRKSAFSSCSRVVAFISIGRGFRS
eukprot:COSAG04_NODE_1350_length_7125_cov_2.893711_4_plen_154_part_00